MEWYTDKECVAGGHSPKSNKTVSSHMASTFKGPDFSVCVSLILNEKTKIVLKLYNKSKTFESEEKVHGLPFLSYFPGRY